MFEIPEKIYKEIVDFARKEKPDEACGIIGGVEGRAVIFYPMINTEKSPESYLMAPEEQFSVMKDLRAKNLTMVAVFHSHPHSSAYPSKKDIEMAFYPVIYLILSLEHLPELRGFKIDRKSGAIQEIKIKIDA